MSGLFSSIFDGVGNGHGGSGMSSGAAPEANESGNSSTHENTTSAGAHAEHGVDLDPHVGITIGGSYTYPDGETTSWSHSDEVGAQVDNDAAFSAAAGLTEMTLHGDVA